MSSRNDAVIPSKMCGCNTCGKNKLCWKDSETTWRCETCRGGSLAARSTNPELRGSLAATGPELLCKTCLGRLCETCKGTTDPELLCKTCKGRICKTCKGSSATATDLLCRTCRGRLCKTCKETCKESPVEVLTKQQTEFARELENDVSRLELENQELREQLECQKEDHRRVLVALGETHRDELGDTFAAGAANQQAAHEDELREQRNLHIIEVEQLKWEHAKILIDTGASAKQKCRTCGGTSLIDDDLEMWEEYGRCAKCGKYGVRDILLPENPVMRSDPKATGNTTTQDAAVPPMSGDWPEEKDASETCRPSFRGTNDVTQQGQQGTMTLTKVEAFRNEPTERIVTTFPDVGVQNMTSNKQGHNLPAMRGGNTSSDASMEGWFLSNIDSIAQTACTAKGRNLLMNIIRMQHPDKIQIIFEGLCEDFSRVITDSQGCQCFRDLVDYLQDNHIDSLCAIMTPNLAYSMCTYSRHSRRLLQSVVERHKTARLQPLVELICANGQGIAIARTQQGSIAVMRMLENVDDSLKSFIFESIAPAFQELAKDQFGNYALQTAIAVVGRYQLTPTFLSLSVNDFVATSKNKFGSNVMQKLVAAVDVEVMNGLVSALCVHSSRDSLDQLVNCEYGNLVVQGLLEVTSRARKGGLDQHQVGSAWDRHRQLCNAILPMLHSRYSENIKDMIVDLGVLMPRPTGADASAAKTDDDDEIYRDSEVVGSTGSKSNSTLPQTVSNARGSNVFSANAAPFTPIPVTSSAGEQVPLPNTRLQVDATPFTPMPVTGSAGEQAPRPNTRLQVDATPFTPMPGAVPNVVSAGPSPQTVSNAAGSSAIVPKPTLRSSAEASAIETDDDDEIYRDSDGTLAPAPSTTGTGSKSNSTLPQTVSNARGSNVFSANAAPFTPMPVTSSGGEQAPRPNTRLKVEATPFTPIPVAGSGGEQAPPPYPFTPNVVSAGTGPQTVSNATGSNVISRTQPMTREFLIDRFKPIDPFHGQVVHAELNGRVPFLVFPSVAEMQGRITELKDAMEVKYQARLATNPELAPDGSRLRKQYLPVVFDEISSNATEDHLTWLLYQVVGFVPSAASRMSAGRFTCYFADLDECNAVLRLNKRLLFDTYGVWTPQNDDQIGLVCSAISRATNSQRTMGVELPKHKAQQHQQRSMLGGTPGAGMRSDPSPGSQNPRRQRDGPTLQQILQNRAGTE